jgi:hypothetical protein
MIDLNNFIMHASALRTKNGLLSGILDECNDFNQIPDSPGRRLDKIAQLDRVAQVAGWYLTSRPPKPTSKNKARWDAVQNLLEQLAEEASGLGVKQLAGQKDYRLISNKKRSYWLEKLDPEHRVGFELAPLFKNWLNDPSSKGKGGKSFWEFIGTNLNASDLDAVVKYYTESTVYDNLNYLLCFDAGSLRDHTDSPFDTRTNITAVSGNGWAIFVCSPDGKIFAGSHVVGQHHHSSFLSGGAVKAAGEIVADNGVVRVVTAKSGHYIPDATALRRFLCEFRMIPANAIVRPDYSDERGGNPPRFYRVGEFREKALAAPTLNQKQIRGQTPPWARTPQFNEMLAKIAP